MAAAAERGGYPATIDAARVPEAAAPGAPTRVDDLTLERRLGRGYFGEVWQAKDKAGACRTFAVKKVKLQLINDNRMSGQLRREIDILYKLNHPRIVELFFDFQDGKYMYLGMEFASGGSIFDKLSKSGRFSKELAARYFLETCEALDYLHHLPEKVIHRDIKPENILLDREDSVKLADFGWANLLEADKRDTFCGTLDYLPPEMIMREGHDESVDMWNMGVLLYELSTGTSPFGSSNRETTCRNILQVDLRFPADIDPDARDLVAGLCKKKPKDRFPVRSAMSHRFITKHLGPDPGAVRQAPTAEVAAADPEAESAESRPSVVARGLRKEREKIDGEMQQLLLAKQNTESKLNETSRELDEVRDATQVEKKSREETQELSAQLKRICSNRERELEELRKRVRDLETQAAKLRGGTAASPGWFGRKR